MGIGLQRLSVRAGLLLSVLVPVCTHAAALNIRNHYSPHNRERARRAGTEYIILHTTEGATKGSIDKIHARGEAHYAVDTAGTVYRIIHRDRIAYHAGLSMWNGRTNLDRVALGIETVGYHDRPITPAQEQALRELLVQLQRIYRVPDDRVLPHCMVAYGAPNRWHKHPHRGRKRCGLLFAQPALRQRLGLGAAPGFDPDVRAGRLTAADPYLEDRLFGARNGGVTDAHGTVIEKGRSAWDIARDRYAAADTVYIFPDGTRRRGSDISDWEHLPAGTRVLLGSGEQGP
jgi:N-acetylmuramoyl-L-alanine amidase